MAGFASWWVMCVGVSEADFVVASGLSQLNMLRVGF